MKYFPRKVDIRLTEKEIQTPTAQGRSTKIISMIKWIRTSRLSIKNSLSEVLPSVAGGPWRWRGSQSAPLRWDGTISWRISVIKGFAATGGRITTNGSLQGDLSLIMSCVVRVRPEVDFIVVEFRGMSGLFGWHAKRGNAGFL